MPAMVSSAWLTAARLARLCIVLRQLPSNLPGLPMAQVVRVTWTSCGGPFDEVGQLVEILLKLGLIIGGEEAIRRNKEGHRIARAVGKGDMRELGISLVCGGCFHD